MKARHATEMDLATTEIEKANSKILELEDENRKLIQEIESRELHPSTPDSGQLRNKKTEKMPL